MLKLVRERERKREREREREREKRKKKMMISSWCRFCTDACIVFTRIVSFASSELCFFLLQFQRARARLHQADLNGLTFHETRHSRSTRTTISWLTQSELLRNP
jgi:hypothetical protein